MIYLLCPAGHPNFGDELIAASWLRYLAGSRPGERVVVDCHSPGKAATLLAGLHPDLVVTDTCWRLGLNEAPPGGAADAAVADLGLAPDLGAGLRQLLAADTLHVLGGGWLTSLWPQHTRVLSVVTRAARESDARLVATGQGVTPLGSSSEEYVRLFRQFSTVDVRDGASAAALKEHVPRDVLMCTGDDVWLAPPDLLGGEHARPGGVPLDGRTTVLCLQGDLLGAEVDAVAQRVLDLLATWGVVGPDIAVLEGVPGIDVQVFERMRALAPAALRLEEARIIPFVDVWAHGLPTPPGGATWISTRFHPHLLAAASGARGVVLAAHGGGAYYSAKHRSVHAVGSRWTTCELTGELSRPGAGMTPDEVARARGAKETLAADLYERS